MTGTPGTERFIVEIDPARCARNVAGAVIE
jgi:hypothetical protein